SQSSLNFAFAIANCAVLLFTCFAGVFGNVLVIWAVCRQRSLQTSNNALLVNLATSDLLRCVIDCPLLLAIILWGYNINDLGSVLCHTQAVSFSLSCCVQLLTLASISAERYQAIAHPFKTSQRKRRVKIWIPLTWTLAVLVSSFCITIAEDTPVYVKCRGIRVEVLTSFDTFGLYILVPIWFASLTVIIGFYGRIFIVVRAHTKKIFDKGTSSLPPPAKKGKDVRIDGKQLADKTNSEEENKSKANNDTRWLGNRSVALPSISVIPEETVEERPTSHAVKTTPGCLSSLPSSTGEYSQGNLFNRERAKAGKEGKLAKRSGYIVITFIAFWMPLIISVLMNPFTLHNPGTVQKILEVETFAVALACMTAAVNPITYAVVNPQFRSEFRQLKTKYKSK
uniref:G-protein coupled receptors family 1 profile domain-containing protein n=1 Tax=Lepisosteus oculatus TaxID=7918 RepID=W5NFN3_LEPOC